MMHPSELLRALAGCVALDGSRRQAFDELPDAALPDLAALAVSHRVFPFLGIALADRPNVDPHILDTVRQAEASTAATQLRILADLDMVREALDHHDITWAVLKGPVLSERLYPAPALRPYLDLDILVASASFERAIEALQDAGAPIIDRNWSMILREQRAQLHLRLRLGSVLDAHWDIVNRRSVRKVLSVPTDEILSRTRDVDVADRSVRALDPTDGLLHICLHAALSGANRLLWFADVDRAIGVDPPAWDLLIGRARQWRISVPVAIVLERAVRLIGARVPPDVVAALVDVRSRHALDRIMYERWARRGSPEPTDASAVWAQISRDSWGATAQAAGARFWRRSRTVMSRNDGTRIEPIFRDRGGETEMRKYFQAILTESRRR